MLKTVECHLKKVKSFLSLKPIGAADLCFLKPQPDTSLYCKTTNTRLVHHVVHFFTSQLSLVVTAPTTD